MKKFKIEQFFKVEVGGVFIDPMTQTPVVFLVEKKRNIYLPIWIGFIEAQIIHYYLRDYLLPRPYTSELLFNILTHDFKGKIIRTVISDIVDGIFFADLFYRDKEGKIYLRDLRPSDAIALSLRSRSPIYLAFKTFNSFHKGEKQRFKKLYMALKSSPKLSEIFQV